LEALERRVMVKKLRIQQAKLEIDGGSYQPQEQLEKVRLEPTQGKVTVKISQEEAEKQLSNETTEIESVAEWPLSATKGNKDSMGDRADFPIEKTKVQWSWLQKENQPWEQLDEIIEEIRRLMIISVETTSEENLSRRKPTIAVGQ
jgi:hypothetical protein